MPISPNSSMALLADGFHMATHAGALGLAAITYAYAKRHVRDAAFSFGTGKVGDLAGFASALMLGLVALGIAVESATRLFTPVRVAFAEATLIAVIGLVVNIASALLLAGGGHHHANGDHGDGHGGDNNLRSAYVHVLADALTSVLAIVALVAGRYLGWVWLDPAMGMAGALVINCWSWRLMRDTAGVLLDRTDADLAEEIRALIEASGNARITDLHVWRIGPEAHAAIAGIAGDARITPASIRERLMPMHELAHLSVECNRQLGRRKSNRRLTTIDTRYI